MKNKLPFLEFHPGIVILALPVCQADITHFKVFSWVLVNVFRTCYVQFVALLEYNWSTFTDKKLTSPD